MRFRREQELIELAQDLGRATLPALAALALSLLHLASVAAQVAHGDKFAATADLSVKLEAKPDPVTPGAALTYRITVSNRGPVAAEFVTVAISLPYGVTVKKISMAGGDCSVVASVPFCDLEKLSVGKSAIAIVVADVDERATTLAAKAVVASSDNELDPMDDNRAYLITGLFRAEPPPPPDSDEDCEDSACKREQSMLRGEISDLRQRSVAVAKDRNFIRQVQREYESLRKTAGTLKQQYGDCVADLKRDAATAKMNIYTDGSGRIVGIAAVDAADNELIEANQKTLSDSVTLCNSLYDKWRNAYAEANEHIGPSAKELADDKERELADIDLELAKKEAAQKDAEARCAALQELCRAEKNAASSRAPCEGPTCAAKSENDYQTRPADKSGAETGAAPEPSPLVIGVFVGSWQTNWGMMRLVATSQTELAGSYDNDNGRLFLTFKDGQARGTWVEDTADQRCATTVDGSHYWGSVVLILDEAGENFAGEWGYCDSLAIAGVWTGTRVE